MANNTRAMTYLCKNWSFKNKVYCNNYIFFFSLGDIINKVTLQYTIPKYSPLNLCNPHQFIQKMQGTRKWAPRSGAQNNLTPLLSRWHWALMPKPTVPNSLDYVKYFSGCIVWISNGSLNQIWFILAHVICTVVTYVPVSMPSLAK